MTSSIGSAAENALNYCMQYTNSSSFFKIWCYTPEISFRVSQALEQNCSARIVEDFHCKWSQFTIAYASDSSCDPGVCQYLYNIFNSCVNTTADAIAHTYYTPTSLSACARIGLGIGLGVPGMLLLGCLFFGVRDARKRLQKIDAKAEIPDTQEVDCSKVRSCWRGFTECLGSIGSYCRRRNYTKLSDSGKGKEEL